MKKARPKSVGSPATHIGKYELVARIGEGGMAEVFLARQTGPMGFEKLVVVKRLREHLCKKHDFVNMFLDEARIAAGLSHPNVVQIYDLSKSAGVYFIAMEYLAGESLASLLTRARKREMWVSPALSASIIARAALGLHAAHELKSSAGQPLEVVHRDVSPANIVVLYDGAVKVVDFGVAKARGRLTETTAGQLKGKFAYMSPEQLRNEPIDRRSDIFALGAVLWEMLARRRLFKKDSEGATVTAVLTREPPPPSKYRPEVPKELDDIALRAIAKAPGDRFPTAEEMAELLEKHVHSTGLNERKETSGIMSLMFPDRIAARRSLLERASEGPVDAALAEPVLDQSDSSSLSFTDDFVSDPPAPEIDEVTDEEIDVAALERKALELEEPTSDLAAPQDTTDRQLAPFGLDTGDLTLQEAVPEATDRHDLPEPQVEPEPEPLPQPVPEPEPQPAPVLVTEKHAARIDSTAVELKPKRRWVPFAAAAAVLGAALFFIDRDPAPIVVEHPQAPPVVVKHLPPPPVAAPSPPPRPPVEVAKQKIAPVPPKPARTPARARGEGRGGRAVPMRKTGRLFLATFPPSTIYRGADRLGQTPLDGFTLFEGKHLLTAVDARGRKLDIEVEIASGQDTRLIKKF